MTRPDLFLRLPLFPIPVRVRPAHRPYRTGPAMPGGIPANNFVDDNVDLSLMSTPYVCKRVGREAAVEQLRQQPAKVVAIMERHQVGIAAGELGIAPAGGDGRFQRFDRLGRQGLLLVSPNERNTQRQAAGNVIDVGRVSVR